MNNWEKVLGIFLMILGIAFFSYIMQNFNEVLINYDKKMGFVDYGSELQVWLNSLSKFTSKKPLPRSLVKKIDGYFRFYWKNDRLTGVTIDDQYLKLMPKNLRYELIIHLFDDIFYTFRTFFMRQEFVDSQERFFFYKIAFYLLPRKVEAGEEILAQGDDVNLMYFIMDGEIKVEFEYPGGKVTRYFLKGFYFGDYNTLYNKPAAFTYKATTNLFVYTIPYNKFSSLIPKYPAVHEKI